MGKSKNSLDPKLPKKVTPGREDTAVLAALEVIEKDRDEKDERDGKNDLIQELLENGFSVQDPTGTRKLDAYVLQQAFWRTANRMKPLDFQVHASGRPEAMEKIVAAAISQVMSDGGYLSALRDKGGAFNYLLLFGDGFVQVGTDEENDNIPIKFVPLANSNVYVDTYATDMRAGGPGRSVSKMVVVQSMSWGDVLANYPEAEKKGAGPGAIPRETNPKETGRSYLQTDQEDKDYTEVAHFYDISNRVYTQFIGTECTVVKRLDKSRYPFVIDKKPYIPNLHFKCWPSVEGFRNHGLGDMLYKLAIMQRRLINLAVGHVEDNTYPITLVNVPNQEVSKFFNKLMAANEMRAAGKKGFVAMEYDPSSPNAGKVTSDQLLTQSMMNEWAMIFDRLDREIQRLGINLNDIDMGANVTATQVMQEEESSNAFVKQIGEYNASEYKFAVELTIDFIKKFVKKGNKTLVDLTTKIRVDDEELQLNEITLGAVADELRKNDYFVKVNARTGAVPSNIMMQAQISKVLAITPPGTPAYIKLAMQLAQLNDRDLQGEDFSMVQPQGVGAEAGESGGKAIPTETDRTALDVRASEPEAVL